MAIRPHRGASEAEKCASGVSPSQYTGGGTEVSTLADRRCAASSLGTFGMEMAVFQGLRYPPSAQSLYVWILTRVDHAKGRTEDGAKKSMPKICGEPRGEATGKELWTGGRRGGDQDVTLVTSESSASEICAPNLPAILKRHRSSKPLAKPVEAIGPQIRGQVLECLDGNKQVYRGDGRAHRRQGSSARAARSERGGAGTERGGAGTERRGIAGSEWRGHRVWRAGSKRRRGAGSKRRRGVGSERRQRTAQGANSERRGGACSEHEHEGWAANGAGAWAANGAGGEQ
ncbi:hypothetical protein B0H14DRAFT_2633736 [Mycena olivaceomarginata]|nr:hypothetical protein B0H14DRAFT_2633736 [Mycena olivaceomarginata]